MRRKHERGTRKYAMSYQDTAETYVQVFAQERRLQKPYLDVVLGNMSTRTALAELRDLQSFVRWFEEHMRKRWSKEVEGQDLLSKDILFERCLAKRRE